MKKVFCSALLGVFCYSFLAAPYAEASFWEERRSSVEKTAESEPALLAQLPTGNLPRIRPLISRQNIVPDADNLSLPQFIKNRLPAGFALPLAFANFKRARIPQNWKPGDPLVIHIQDVHQNFEAQENISKSIQELIGKGQADLVALEGAFEAVDVSRFRTFEDPESVHKAADFLMKEGKVTGAIHTALTSRKEIPPFVGVDDEPLYNAHVRAYQDSAPKVRELKERLVETESAINAQKQKIFSPELADFDKKVQAYRSGTAPLGEHVKSLSETDPSFQGEMVPLFLKALSMEHSLNFAKVEDERASMLNILVKKLDKNETGRLVNLSLAYRLGRIRHTDFYGYLKTLCARSGVPVENYPALSDYLDYVLVSDRINAEKLMTETQALENKIYGILAKTEQEKNLIAESRKQYLTDKLIDFSLTAQEWKEYQGSALISENFPLASFESFFRHAELRDAALTQNLLKAVSAGKAKTAVLVTGGYHSAGMENLLEKLEPRAAVITLSPKITKIENASGTEYLSIFTREKSPLDKLFDGDKLFLPQRVWTSGLVRLLASDAGAAFPELANGPENVPDTLEAARFSALAGPSAGGFSVTAEDIDGGVRVEPSNAAEGAVPYSLLKDAEGNITRQVHSPQRRITTEITRLAASVAGAALISMVALFIYTSQETLFPLAGSSLGHAAWAAILIPAVPFRKRVSPLDVDHFVTAWSGVRGVRTLIELETLAGIPRKSIKTPEFKELLKKVNLRLQVINPDKKLIKIYLFGDIKTAIRDYLQMTHGKINIRKMAADLRISRRIIYNHGIEKLVREEMTRRKTEEPSRLPIMLKANRRDIEYALSKWRQPFHAARFSKALGVSVRTLYYHDYDQLVQAIRRKPPLRTAVLVLGILSGTAFWGRIIRAASGENSALLAGLYPFQESSFLDWNIVFHTIFDFSSIHHFSDIAPWLLHRTERTLYYLRAYSSGLDPVTVIPALIIAVFAVSFFAVNAYARSAKGKASGRRRFLTSGVRLLMSYSAAMLTGGGVKFLFFDVPRKYPVEIPSYSGADSGAIIKSLETALEKHLQKTGGQGGFAVVLDMLPLLIAENLPQGFREMALAHAEESGVLTPVLEDEIYRTPGITDKAIYDAFIKIGAQYGGFMNAYGKETDRERRSAMLESLNNPLHRLNPIFRGAVKDILLWADARGILVIQKQVVLDENGKPSVSGWINERRAANRPALNSELLLKNNRAEFWTQCRETAKARAQLSAQSDDLAYRSAVDNFHDIFVYHGTERKERLFAFALGTRPRSAYETALAEGNFDPETQAFLETEAFLEYAMSQSANRMTQREVIRDIASKTSAKLRDAGARSGRNARETLEDEVLFSSELARELAQFPKTPLPKFMELLSRKGFLSPEDAASLSFPPVQPESSISNPIFNRNLFALGLISPNFDIGSLEGLAFSIIAATILLAAWKILEGMIRGNPANPAFSLNPAAGADADSKTAPTKLPGNLPFDGQTIARLTAAQVFNDRWLGNPDNGKAWRRDELGMGTRYDLWPNGKGRWMFVSHPQKLKGTASFQDIFMLNGNGQILNAVRLYAGNIQASLTETELWLDSLARSMPTTATLNLIVPADQITDGMNIRINQNIYATKNLGPVPDAPGFRFLSINRHPSLVDGETLTYMASFAVLGLWGAIKSHINPIYLLPLMNIILGLIIWRIGVWVNPPKPILQQARPKPDPLLFETQNIAGLTAEQIFGVDPFITSDTGRKENNRKYGKGIRYNVSVWENGRKIFICEPDIVPYYYLPDDISVTTQDILHLNLNNEILHVVRVFKGDYDILSILFASNIQFRYFNWDFEYPITIIVPAQQVKFWIDISLGFWGLLNFGKNRFTDQGPVEGAPEYHRLAVIRRGLTVQNIGNNSSGFSNPSKPSAQTTIGIGLALFVAGTLLAVPTLHFIAIPAFVYGFWLSGVLRIRNLQPQEDPDAAIRQAEALLSRGQNSLGDSLNKLLGNDLRLNVGGEERKRSAYASMLSQMKLIPIFIKLRFTQSLDGQLFVIRAPKDISEEKIQTLNSKFMEKGAEVKIVKNSSELLKMAADPANRNFSARNLLISNDDLTDFLVSVDDAPEFLKTFSNVIPIDFVRDMSGPPLVFSRLLEMRRIAEEFAARSQ